MHSERLDKLNKILQKLGIEPLKNSDDVSDKLRLFIDKLYETLIEKPVQGENLFTSEEVNPSVLTHPEEAQENECLYRVPYVSEDNTIICSRFYLTKAKIVEVTVDFCNHCYALQQNLALKEKVNATPASPAIAKFYKKPEKVYCIKDTMWLDPRKLTTKCFICKRERFKMWYACQQNQENFKKSIPDKSEETTK